MTLRRCYALTAPFVSRFLRTDSFASQDTIQPAEVQEVVPPWISSASSERISVAHRWSDMRTEVDVLYEREVRHAPVVRFNHGAGVLGPGGYATKRGRRRLSSDFTKDALRKTTTKAGSVTYVNSIANTQYFGHWLTDGLAQTDLAQDGSYYISNPESWAHCGEYRSALGLRESDRDYLEADEIITYSDFAQGSMKRMRHARMRKKIAETFEKAPDAPEKVFLWRGASGVPRRFCNEDILRDRLVADGWTCVDVMAPLAELYQQLSGAKIVAGMEGSHFNHAHFCVRPGTVMVFFIPHDVFTSVQVGLARTAGNFSGYHVMNGDQANGYQLDFDDFIETVEQTYETADRVGMCWH